MWFLPESHDDVRELAHTRRSFAGTFFLAPDHSAATGIARRRPFADIIEIEMRRLGRQLDSLGVARAKLLAATTRSDLTNVAIADAGLCEFRQGELLVRSRTAFRAPLREPAATDQGDGAGQVARRGVAGAAAGLPRHGSRDARPLHRRRSAARPYRPCGSGHAMQAASFEVARQGYGLETHIPLISILRTGSGDLSRERPGAAEDIGHRRDQCRRGPGHGIRWARPGD